METDGLVIAKAVYGARKALARRDDSRETDDVTASQVMDVTLPLNFLVTDSGQLKVCYLRSHCSTMLSSNFCPCSKKK